MTKTFCDVCQEQINYKEFACNIMLEEVKTNYNLVAGNQSVKQLEKRLIQICHKCYKNNFEKLCQAK